MGMVSEESISKVYGVIEAQAKATGSTQRRAIETCGNMSKSAVHYALKELIARGNVVNDSGKITLTGRKAPATSRPSPAPRKPLEIKTDSKPLPTAPPVSPAPAPSAPPDVFEELDVARGTFLLVQDRIQALTPFQRTVVAHLLARASFLAVSVPIAKPPVAKTVATPPETLREPEAPEEIPEALIEEPAPETQPAPTPKPPKATPKPAPAPAPKPQATPAERTRAFRERASSKNAIVSYALQTGKLVLRKYEEREFDKAKKDFKAEGIACELVKYEDGKATTIDAKKGVNRAKTAAHKDEEE